MTIKELREETGLSQKNFSKLIGVPVRTLQQWDQGRSSPPEYILNLINDKIQRTVEIAQNTYISDLRLKEITSWRCIVKDSFENCNKIHPLQQKKVASLLKEMSASDQVKSVFVFGSSVTNACHIGSDVDIYAEMTNDCNPIKGKYDFEIDFWNNFRADERLKEEIFRKGVQVYER